LLAKRIQLRLHEFGLNKTSIDGFIAKNGIAAPAENPYRPLWAPARERPELDFRAAGITSVVWCIDFRTDYS
jgi:putative flavoprotein involved in K+ transport